MMKKVLTQIIFCFMTLVTVISADAKASDVLTEEELALLHEEEVYYVGYSTDNAPMTYFNSEGDFTGIAYELLKEIGQETGLTFEFIDVAITEYTDLSFLAFTTLMKNYNIRPASASYTQYPFLEVRLSHAQEEAVTVGIADQLGINGLEEVREGLSHIEPIIYKNFEELVLALDSGEIDTMITTTLTYGQMVRDIESGKYQVDFLENSSKFRFFYNAAFPEEIQAIFNKLFENVDQSLIQRLLVEHTYYVVDTESHVGKVISTQSPIPLPESELTILTPDSTDMEENPTNSVGIPLVFLILAVAGVVLLINKGKTQNALNYDKLTGLYTQEKFIVETARILKEKPEDDFTILTLDIDNFKYINEVYGFETGSKVLIALAKAMVIEKKTHTVVGRISADNFVFLYKGSTKGENLYDQKLSYEKIREEISKLISEDFNLSFSVGVFPVKDKSADVNYMIDCSVTARNVGKKVASNTINVYTEAMGKEREISNQIITTMHAALERKEFVVYYQSKIDIVTEKLVGAEALVRWKQDGTIVPPNDFIPVFEKNGFIEKLDYYVLEAVCIFIQENSDKNFPLISVNLSGITLMQDNLVERVVEIIQAHEITPSQLELEITESAFVDIFEKNVMKLEKLQEIGFHISMDDFGTGVSSLQRLNDFPLNTLKVDRSFIVKSTLEKKGGSILSSIVQMAKNLQLNTVGEGVETEQQLALLKALGCDMVQGYYYSKPLEGTQFIEKYSEYISGTA